MQQASETALSASLVGCDQQRCQIVADLVVEKALQSDAQPLALCAVEELAVQHLHPWQQRAATALQAANRHAVPDDRVVVAKGEGAVGPGLHHSNAARHLLAERPACGAQHEALLVALCRWVRIETKAADPADRVAL